ncbi:MULTISPECIES: GNAT family N-acetyltransferase [Streptomyces]|uniref:GNAT family N-acetyltransferase n=1 Tax=Streptomyces sudanensis TaxID=436397 RepID=A0ABY4T970_9ACTN|nr:MULTISPECIES: GNAT family N-acetyltransferase [Streptomyces]MCP9957824.1 GNAT family N-acetyltransferase [Streptomyces sudanensis]MCP9986953.1 GNAT family N-acetyltransferase [Streptomyces sudanensis]MCQ0001637.1 GNAT family N-acetyltransferase [Streptomyces sudanensis]URN15514.1 GNAT family N-acetyltransferase [Streptomyces sudanensis]
MTELLRSAAARPVGGPAFRLRVPVEEDAYAWHRVFDDPEVMEFHGGRSAELSFYHELTARQRRHDAERGFCLWTLLDEAGEVVGFTGAQPWPHPWGPVGEIELGWRLARPAWGLGYATAAARQTLERLRAAGVEHVVAMVHTRNERSIAVVRRLGMTLRETVPIPGREGEAGHRFDLRLQSAS